MPTLRLSFRERKLELSRLGFPSWSLGTSGTPFALCQSKGERGLDRLTRKVIACSPLMLRQALKKQLFCTFKINCLQAYKKIKKRLKQRLFLGNAMPPKGAYFAQHERAIAKSTAIFRVMALS